MAALVDIHFLVTRECFGALEAEHEQLLEKAKDEVLQFLLHFKAVIKVQVIQAEKLAVREDGKSFFSNMIAWYYVELFV